MVHPTVEYNAIVKKNVADLYTSTWKNVHDILSEICKRWKSRFSMIPFL